MSSPVLRGAVIGGIVAVILHVVVRAILRNLHWILLATSMLFVLDRCSPHYPLLAAKRAVRNSFDHSKVSVTAVRGETPADLHWRYVEAVSAVVSNGAKARIYDLRLRCSFSGRVAGASEATFEGRSSVTTSYHYGYVEPGTNVSVRLEVNGNGYLSRADPATFECAPTYEVETSDLFKRE